MSESKYQFYLRASERTRGNITELELLSLHRCGASKRTLPEAWLEFLASEGFNTGPLPERQYAWLGSRGFNQKSLEERFQALYKVTGTSPLCINLPASTYVAGGYVVDGYVV